MTGRIPKHTPWLIVSFVLLVVFRALWIHPDPTDYPIDRNFTTVQAALEIKRGHALDKAGVETGSRFLSLRELAPELPVQPWLAAQLSRTGLDLVIAVRLIALAAAILTGWGLLILARLLFPSRPLIPCLALLIYAVNPLAILMGRSLLPDPLMMAALIWSFVFATRQSRNGLICAMGCFAAAVLLKLPALFFAPVLGWLWLGPQYHKEKSRWGWLAIGFGIVWLISCAWYRLAPWNPLPGLHRLSANTNKVFSGWQELSNSGVYHILLDRIVFAWTLPGALLVLIGIVSMPRASVGSIAGSDEASKPFGLWCWFIVSVGFLLLTAGANVYWAYIVCPLGAVLGAAGLAEIFRYSFRWMVVTIVAVFSLVPLDPGTELLENYLNRPLKYPPLRSVSEHLGGSGNAIIDGEPPFVADWFTGRAGVDVRDFEKPEALQQFLEGKWPYLISTRPGSQLVKAAFDKRPIISFRAGSYVMFDASAQARIGTDTQATTATTAMNLANFINIYSISLQPQQARAGDKVKLQLTIGRGVNYSTTTQLLCTAKFQLQPNGESFCVAPESGGAFLFNAGYPVLQLPDFSKGATQQIEVSFKMPEHMPAGDYTFGLALRDQYLVPVTDWLTSQKLLEIVTDEKTATADRVQIMDAIRYQPEDVIELKWWGRQLAFATLSGQQSAIFRARVAAGHFRLKLKAKALPAGSLAEQWPVLVVRQPHTWHEIKLDHTGWHEYGFEFDWRGAGDYFQCYIKNPYHEFVHASDFPLYTNEIRGIDRGAVLDTAEFIPSK